MNLCVFSPFLLVLDFHFITTPLHCEILQFSNIKLSFFTHLPTAKPIDKFLTDFPFTDSIGNTHSSLPPLIYKVLISFSSLAADHVTVQACIAPI